MKNKSPQDVIFYFGQYKGKNITEVPVDYLRWIVDNKAANYTMIERIKQYLTNNP
jgi:uncharacterized protein (DUF3820 family)